MLADLDDNGDGGNPKTRPPATIGRRRAGVADRADLDGTITPLKTRSPAAESRAKRGEKCVKFNLNVEKYDNFCRFVVRKHGTTRGIVARELENAMDEYLRKYEYDVVRNDMPLPSRRGMQTMIVIKNHLMEYGKYPYMEPLTLKAIITNDCELKDKRSITKYLKLVSRMSVAVEHEGFNSPLDVSGFVEYVDDIRTQMIRKDL